MWWSAWRRRHQGGAVNEAVQGIHWGGQCTIHWHSLEWLDTPVHGAEWHSLHCHHSPWLPATQVAVRTLHTGARRLVHQVYRGGDV